MRAVIKLLGYLIALTVIVVVGLAVYLSSVDPNDYKEMIEERITAAIGKEIEIAGDIDWSIDPRLSIRLTDVRVANAPGFGDTPLAEIERIDLSAETIPLLKGRFEIGRIEIAGLHLDLVRDERGRANWETTEAKTEPARPVDEPSQDGDTDSGNSGIPESLRIAGIHIGNTRIHYRDEPAGVDLHVAGLDFSTSVIRSDRPVKMDISGSISERNTQLRASFKGRTSLRFENGAKGIEVTPFRFEITRLKYRDALEMSAKLTAEVHANIERQRLKITHFDAQAAGQADALPARNFDITFGGEGTLDLIASTFSLAEISLQANGLAISGTAQGSNLADKPTLEGELALSAVNLREWLKYNGLALELSNPDAISRVAMSARFDLDANRLKLDDLAIDIDETRVTGLASAMFKDPPQYQFNLHADRLDLDAYMPPPSAQTNRDEPTEGETVSARSADAPILEPVATALRAIEFDLTGRLGVDEFKAAKIALGDMTIDVDATTNQFRIADQIDRFYSGRLAGKLVLDTMAKTPRVAFEQRAIDIEVGPLLLDLVGDDKLTGTGDLILDLSSAGITESELKRELDGEASVDFAMGTIEGFDPQQIVERIRAKRSGKPAPDTAGTRTPFSTLSASALIRDGVLENDDLSIVTDYLEVGGQGRVDIARELIDYRLEAMFIKPPEGRFIKEIEGIPIPIEVTGTFDDPQRNFETNGLLRTIAKKRLGRLGDADDEQDDAEEPDERRLRELGKRLRRLISDD